MSNQITSKQGYVITTIIVLLASSIAGIAPFGIIAWTLFSIFVIFPTFPEFKEFSKKIKELMK